MLFSCWRVQSADNRSAHRYCRCSVCHVGMFINYVGGVKLSLSSVLTGVYLRGSLYQNLSEFQFVRDTVKTS